MDETRMALYRATKPVVESGDYLDSEDNIVSVDNDFSRATEVKVLWNRPLKSVEPEMS